MPGRVWIGVVAGSLLLPAVAHAGAPEANFSESPLPRSPSAPVVGTVAEVTGDSIPDLVLGVDTFDGGSVRVAAGDGSGRFAEPATIATGVAATSVVAGDLNGDGRADVAATFSGAADDRGPGEVAVFLNNGAGLTALPRIAVGDEPLGLVLAELNGDGRLDAALFDEGPESQTVTPMFGDGAGGLVPQPAIAVGACTNEIEVGDVEPDGDADLIVADGCEPPVTILEGNGAGGFTPRPVPGSTAAVSLELADLDENGAPDLVYSPGAARQVAVQRAQPGGYAAPATSRFAIRHFAIEVVDLDGDGNLDLVAGDGNFTYNETGQLEIRIGDGTGDLSQATVFAGKGGGAGADYPSGTLAVADLNLDGRPDVVSTDSPYAAFLATDAPLPSCNGQVATIVGRPKDDGIKATPGADVVVADAGRDVVDGLMGDDTICGGGDQDFIEGFAGDDTIIGGGARDDLNGDDGRDTLSGAGGNDTLEGGEGPDGLTGGPGFDRCAGGQGKDHASSCEKVS